MTSDKREKILKTIADFMTDIKEIAAFRNKLLDHDKVFEYAEKGSSINCLTGDEYAEITVRVNPRNIKRLAEWCDKTQFELETTIERYFKD